MNTNSTYEPTASLWCRAVSEGWNCTRRRGHTGDHTAHISGGEVVMTWPLQAAQAPTLTVPACACTDAGCSAHPGDECHAPYSPHLKHYTVRDDGVALVVCEKCLEHYTEVNWVNEGEVPFMRCEVDIPEFCKPDTLRCHAQQPRQPHYVCTRTAGHAGDHVGHDGDGVILASWPAAMTPDSILPLSVPLPADAEQHGCDQCGEFFYEDDSSADSPEQFCCEDCEAAWNRDNADPEPDEDDGGTEDPPF